MLDPPVLKARKQPAVRGDAIAGLVKDSIDDLLIQNPIHPGQPDDRSGDELNQAFPHPAIEPITGTRPPGNESDKKPFIRFIDVVLCVEAT